MNMRKRILCMVLALCMMLAAVPMSAAALSTPNLAALYQAADQAYEDTVNPNRKYDVYALTTAEVQVMDEVYTYLTRTMGLNTAAACGILGNILCESRFDVDDVSSSGKYVGLIQWAGDTVSDTTGYSMKSWIAENGYELFSVAGQMAYLHYHLAESHDYKCDATYSYLKGVENTATGAYNAGYYFCYNYERPGNKESASTLRGTLAAKILYTVYSKIDLVDNSNGTAVAPGPGLSMDSGTGTSDLPFQDVAKSSWYYDMVKIAYQNGFFSGTSATTFEPTAAMSRAQVVQVLYNVYLKEGNARVTGTSTFSDVSSKAWYSEAVTWAQQSGVVNGLGNNNFGPEQEITKEQFAQILYNYNEKIGLYSADIAGDLSAFGDHSAVKWSLTAMQWAVGIGVIKGTVKNGKAVLAPQDICSRAEAATIIVRYFGAN
jgi:hypothetical protein